MTNQKRKLFQEEVEPTHYIVGEVYYDKGGPNYFSGGTSRRGYYFSVRPETVKDGMRSYLMFSGGAKKLLKEAKRFNAKELESVNPSSEEIAEIKARVLASAKWS